MKTSTLEPLLRNATIKAIDGISDKLKKAEDEAETMVSRLLSRWSAMTPGEKENVVGIVIATAGAAVTAIAAARAAMPKKAMKRAGRKVVKKIARKLD